ncbi:MULTISPECIES: type IV secretion system protein [Bartonella]|uniref:type IV secretion system protein n=1 Tax=Bartonella TaxID=773 RepID=UPI00236113D4|nr:type IV secretion system protein [Bartonella grahamii]
MTFEKVAYFTTAENMLMEPIMQIMKETIKNLSMGLSAPLKASCTIYIIFIGYNIISGRSSMPLWEFIVTAFKLGIIVSLATNAALYNEWVGDMFFEALPNAIAHATQGTIHSDKNIWDDLINKAVSHILNSTKSASWLALGAYLVSWIYASLCYTIAIIFCLIGFIVTLFAKLGLFLVISVGPLFISLYMFSSTRRFTEAWLGQVANFIILQVLVILLGGMYIKLAMNVFSKDIKDFVLAYGEFFVVGVGGIFLFFNLPGMASALASGGASLTGSGGAKTITKGAKKLASLIAQLAKA